MVDQIEKKESLVYERALHMSNTARQIKQNLEKWKQKLEDTVLQTILMNTTDF